MKSLVIIENRQVITTSLIIAQTFERNHKDVLRAIESLECSDEFTERNFAPSGYKDSTGRPLPMFNITRDGFMFLAMGFTGRRAAQFKEDFIKAFNLMEKALIEGERPADRRVDVNMRHTRGISNPHGLDIKYTLDLTKICMRPTKHGIAILERLTGMDMSDITDSEEYFPEVTPAGNIFTAWEQERLTHETGVRSSASAIFFDFKDWYQQATGLPVPSQKWFGGEMARRGFHKKKVGGNVFYYGIALATGEGIIY